MSRANLIVRENVEELLSTNLEDEIKKLIRKHNSKIHFVPLKYRVLGGFLQSLNIRFGNLLESIVSDVISENTELIVLDESGKKNVSLEFKNDIENRIGRYLTECQQTHPEGLNFTKFFSSLVEYQISQESNNYYNKSTDVDVFLKNPENETYYYIEVKYNDDHDTGKYENINRKFIRTAAGLYRLIHQSTGKDSRFKPLLYYFNDTTKFVCHYLKDGEDVLRGGQLLEYFGITNFTYKDLRQEFENSSVNLEEYFDKVTERIFKIVSNVKNVPDLLDFM